MIKVVIPAYNCMAWLERCLDSVASQKGVSYEVCVIDDASTDPDQAAFIEKYCSDKGWQFILNQRNLKCPHNLKLGAAHLEVDGDDILFLLDGDDYLPHINVFQRIQREYTNPDCWMTYGSYDCDPPADTTAQAEPYPRSVMNKRSYRHSNTLFNHLITVRGWFWNKIEDSDLQFPDGSWFNAAYDETIMYPLLEMGGPHCRYVKDILYTYNADNPISEWREMPDISKRVTDQLRENPVKSQLYLDRTDFIQEILAQTGLDYYIETGFLSARDSGASRNITFTDVENYRLVMRDCLSHGTMVIPELYSPEFDLLYWLRYDARILPPAVWWIEAHVEIKEIIFLLFHLPGKHVFLIEPEYWFSYLELPYVSERTLIPYINRLNKDLDKDYTISYEDGVAVIQ